MVEDGQAERSCSNLKVLLSIGGWTYGPNFARIAEPYWRAAFVKSAVRLVEDVGLDGLDVRRLTFIICCSADFFKIDYEFPKSPAEAQGYVDLLHELRHGLSKVAENKGRPRNQYQLTVAAPCGWENMCALKVKEMDQVSLASMMK